MKNTEQPKGFHAAMLEAWNTAAPEKLLWMATCPAALTFKELRTFMVFCARSVEHLMLDERSKRAVETAERYLKGEATVEELRDAYAAAKTAATSAAASDPLENRPVKAHPSYADHAARTYAAFAAFYTAGAEVSVYAPMVARTSADALAAEAVRPLAAGRSPKTGRAFDAAKSAAASKQAEWLLANTNPDFDGSYDRNFQQSE